MEGAKRWRLVFRAKGKRRRIIYAFLRPEEEIPGLKEEWAMRLEEETGLAWRCEEVTEAGPVGYIPRREE